MESNERVLIGADIVPTKSNVELFINGRVEELVGKDLWEIFTKTNYKIFNLEVPLTDVETPIDKLGPALIATPKTIKTYKILGVNLLTLANNHILDQGVQGLDSTIKTLEESGISYVGVGDADGAKEPYVFEFASKKVGVYACAEHEFSIVGNFDKGANPFDPLNSLDHISELKDKCDYVIVLYHGGKEHYRYPSPYLQKACQKMVEKGANLVICQHSHCIGCEEKYGNGTIVYGQGNFLFDLSDNEYWQTSLLISLNQNFEVEYLPLIKKKEVVRLADKETSAKILDDFSLRSNQIREKGFIEKEYENFSKQMKEVYLFAFSGIKYGFFSKVINRLTKGKFLSWRIKRRFTKKDYLSLRNYIECEAHRELILKGLNFGD